jgi:hypothetical protein
MTSQRPFSIAAFRIGVLALLVAASGTGARAADKAPPRGQPIRPVGAASPEAVPKPAATNAVPATAAVAPGPSAIAAIGFDVLSTFKYEVPEDAAAGAKPSASAPDPDAQIPANVKSFNGRRIALKGFMLPLKVEGGLVTELLLMRDQSMCCFGTVPKINEWVAVKMTGGGVKPVMDQAVTLSGTIKIGAMRENGYLVGIYQMDGERIEAPGIALQ